MPARNAAHSLSSLKGLFDQTSLLVRAPAAPTFSAQHFHFHSHMTLRLDLRSNPRAASQTTQGGLRRSDTFSGAALVNKHATKAVSRKPSEFEAQSYDPALASENFGGQLPAVFTS